MAGFSAAGGIFSKMFPTPPGSERALMPVQRLSMLILGLLVAVAPGRAAELDSARDKAVAAIQRVGGRISVDETAPGRPVIAVDFRRNKILDADLKALAEFPHLKKLDLYDTGITDAGLAHLASLTRLELLEINSPKVTDAGLKHLKGLVNLKELYLYGTSVSDAGMESLQKMTRLRKLDVSATEVTAAGAIALEKALPRVKIQRGP
jgi:hypothetical protein